MLLWRKRWEVCGPQRQGCYDACRLLFDRELGVLDAMEKGFGRTSQTRAGIVCDL